jgi:hypothetical protein
MFKNGICGYVSSLESSEEQDFPESDGSQLTMLGEIRFSVEQIAPASF